MEQLEAIENDRGTPGENRPIRWKRALLFWLLFPTFVGCSLIIAGAHLGANGPDQWYTRFALWVVGLF